MRRPNSRPWLPRGITVLAVALSVSASSVAQQPATQPTRSQSARARVLVLAFDALAHDRDDAGSIADVMQRSLVVDLGRSRDIHPSGAREVAPDREAALAQGRAAGAAFAVWGNVQMAEGRLRVTGEIVDINRAEAVDHFRLTGTLRDLFELQDDLAERIARKLSVALAPPADESQPAARAEAPPDVPLGEPLRVRPRPLDPDWLSPPAGRHAERLSDLTRRYNHGHLPYWSIPYGYAHPYAYDYYNHRFRHGGTTTASTALTARCINTASTTTPTAACPTARHTTGSARATSAASTDLCRCTGTAATERLV
jgi:TolB-like protein